MTTEHLSEKELQRYVLDGLNCETKIVGHIQICDVCRTNAEMYQLLFTGIKQQPKPAFDFNLSHSVLTQLPQTKPKFSSGMLFIYLIVFATITAFGTSIYLFREYIYNLFKGIFPLFTYLALATALTILFFQSIDLYKHYKKQMAEVEFI